jgi:putative glutamine amidotransferase
MTAVRAARRPMVAIPARFSASASALRFRAEVTARKLVEAVYAAGGEPVVVHPHAPGGEVSDQEVADRLWFADAVLLPGVCQLLRFEWSVVVGGVL